MVSQSLHHFSLRSSILSVCHMAFEQYASDDYVHKFASGFSYCGAQIFEIYGLGRDVVDMSFRGSVSVIGGLALNEVSESKKFS